MTTRFFKFVMPIPLIQALNAKANLLNETYRRDGV
jgi:hypothetical protein